jgi:hypothetical protein
MSFLIDAQDLAALHRDVNIVEHVPAAIEQRASVDYQRVVLGVKRDCEKRGAQQELANLHG